jgi:PEP-CTERM motif-containing protein
VNGSLEAGQSVFAYSNPTATFSAILPVSDSSGNWIVSGYATSSDSSRYALNIFVNGAAAGYIGNGSNSFLVTHAAGAPLTFSFGDNVSAVFGNDIEDLHFSLTFTDPPADPPASTPEPASVWLAGTAGALFFAYRNRKLLQPTLA